MEHDGGGASRRLARDLESADGADDWPGDPEVTGALNPVNAEGADLLSRLVELDRQRKRRRTQGSERLLAQLHESRAGLDDLHRWITDIDHSESWRIGHGVVRVVRCAFRPLTMTLASTRRTWRHRRGNLSRVYRRATSAPSPIATLERLPREAAETDHNSPLADAIRVVRSTRLDGPRLLGEEEVDLLRAALDETDGSADVAGRIRDLLIVAGPRRPFKAQALPCRDLVVEVRALQLPHECGTKTHGGHVVRSIRAALPPASRMLMLTAPRLPDPPADLAALFDDRFVPYQTSVDEVSGYLQLMTAADETQAAEVTLLRAPWIRHGAIWLDGIMGLHPHVFLGADDAFLDYQLGIEKLGRACHIMALSEPSRAELPPNIDPATRITISGSRPGLTRADLSPSTEPICRHPYCVLVGNALPHKNAAAGVAAFAGSRRARRTRMTLFVAVAGLGDAEHRALRAVMVAAGANPEALVFLPQLDRADFASLLHDARATIVPSFHEGYSLPVVESIGLETPVVASDIPAHRSLLGPPAALADPARPEDLAQLLDEVLTYPNETLVRQRRALHEMSDASQFDRAIAELVRDLCQPANDETIRPANGSATHTAPRKATRPDDPTPALLSHSKVCNLEDFSHPDLLPHFRQWFPHEAARFGPSFPHGHEWRKHWEVVMAMRVFADRGLLDAGCDFLGVGAGNEPTIFLLTNHARRVVASDLYLDAGWEETADESMLTDPGWHWPFAWRPRRLEVVHMDARELRFPDESFRGIFSSSSIEHFGDRRSIARALDEMHRVLAPGGVLSISSEYRIAGPRPGIPGAALFDAEDLEELFVGGRTWKPVDQFDGSISSETIDTSLDLAEVIADQDRQIHELGGYWTHLIEFERYPHIVLTCPSHVFTSFHLALQKDG